MGRRARGLDISDLPDVADRDTSALQSSSTFGWRTHGPVPDSGQCSSAARSTTSWSAGARRTSGRRGRPRSPRVRSPNERRSGTPVTTVGASATVICRLPLAARLLASRRRGGQGRQRRPGLPRPWPCRRTGTAPSAPGRPTRTARRLGTGSARGDAGGEQEPALRSSCDAEVPRAQWARLRSCWGSCCVLALHLAVIHPSLVRPELCPLVDRRGQVVLCRIVDLGR